MSIHALFEAGNDNNKQDGNYNYIHNQVPTYLHSYIRDLARNDNNIPRGPTADCCPDLLLCVGLDPSSPYFFRLEGYDLCSKCENTIRYKCTLFDNDKNYCVGFFKNEVMMIPPYKFDAGNELSKSEMIQVLQAYGINYNNDETMQCSIGYL